MKKISSEIATFFMFNKMNVPQKIVFTIWLLSSSIIVVNVSAHPDEQNGYLLGLIFATAIFWVLFKVWADKKG